MVMWLSLAVAAAVFGSLHVVQANDGHMVTLTNPSASVHCSAEIIQHFLKPWSWKRGFHAVKWHLSCCSHIQLPDGRRSSKCKLDQLFY